MVPCKNDIAYKSQSVTLTVVKFFIFEAWHTKV